jgi:D-glycero-D-manno-heptose 1,7-bisphosphate phosphatase
VLLDRDGTINVEKNYLTDPSQLALLPGAAEGLRSLQAAGYLLAVVTNQSAVGRGYMSAERLAEINARFTALLAAEGVRLDGIYACPHAPWDGCGCRKPLPGLVRQAESGLRFKAASAVVIGDNHSDIELGRNVGALTVLVRTGHGREVESQGTASPDFIVDDLREAADLVLSRITQRVSSPSSPHAVPDRAQSA